MTQEQLRTAAEMWAEGFNTFDIAEGLKPTEAEIYNRLDEIKAVKIAEAA